MNLLDPCLKALAVAESDLEELERLRGRGMRFGVALGAAVALAPTGESNVVDSDAMVDEAARGRELTAVGNAHPVWAEPDPLAPALATVVRLLSNPSLDWLSSPCSASPVVPLKISEC